MPEAFTHPVPRAFKDFAVSAGLALGPFGYIFDVHYTYLPIFLELPKKVGSTPFNPPFMEDGR